MKQIPHISIVIPALNEEKRLPATLEAVQEYLSGKEELLPAEILVVDDGSRDRTAELVRKTGSSASLDIRCLQHGETRGKGAAIRTGFAASRGKLVLITDADLSAPIDQLEILLPACSERSIAIGSRAVDRSLIVNPQPLYRDLMGRSFNLLVRMLLLPGLGDTQCGFKLFPGELARALAAAQRVDGFAWDVEYLYLVRHWRFEIRELGVRWAHVEASRVLPGRHSWQMFRDVLKLSLRRILRNFPEAPGKVEI